MTTKEKVISMLSNMPDDSTLDDIGYRLYVLENIEQGLEELDKGEFLDHTEVKKELGKWLKD